MVCAAPRTAAENLAQMIMIMGRFSIEPSTRVAFQLFAKGMIQRQQEQPGCMGIGIFEDVTTPNTYLLVEQWADGDSMDGFYASAIYAHDDEVMSSFVLGEPVFDEYQFDDDPQ
jgi:quinol monooxygenase YgiN